MRQMLDLGSFFTTGADEVRQWTIRKGTKAPQAAGVIHGGMSLRFRIPLYLAIAYIMVYRFRKDLYSMYRVQFRSFERIWR